MNFSTECRLNIINAASSVGSVHFGGNFSLIEILIAYYQPVLEKQVNFDEFIQSNVLILSKGHCGLAVYAVLKLAGVISDLDFESYCRPNGAFMGHIKRDPRLGIGWSTGSLGHGLSVAMGLAKAAQESGQNKRVTCILGDGEMHEGSIWEALLHLSIEKDLPLTIILDNNKQLSLGLTNEIRPIEPIAEKISSFGIENITLDGHNVKELMAAIEDRKKSGDTIFIIANTIKGKGVSFMEGVIEWHAKRANEDQLNQMRIELSRNI